MSTNQITPLDEKLLLGRNAAPYAEDRLALSGPQSRFDDAAYRPGYDLFKILLTFSLFLAIFALSPWSPMKAAPAHGMEAGGYMYLSVPLNAAEPQFDESALRVDVMGAGLHVNVLEMRQDTGTTRVMAGKGKRKDWRAKRRAIESDSRTVGYTLVTSAPKRAHSPRVTRFRSKSAKAHYLALLRAYESESSNEQRRRLYPQLLIAYRKALSAR